MSLELIEQIEQGLLEVSAIGVVVSIGLVVAAYYFLAQARKELSRVRPRTPHHQKVRDGQSNGEEEQA